MGKITPNTHTHTHMLTLSNTPKKGQERRESELRNLTTVPQTDRHDHSSSSEQKMSDNVHTCTQTHHQPTGTVLNRDGGEGCTDISVCLYVCAKKDRRERALVCPRGWETHHVMINTCLHSHLHTHAHYSTCLTEDGRDTSSITASVL